MFLLFLEIIGLNVVLMYLILCVNHSFNPIKNYIFIYLFIINFIDSIDFIYGYLTKKLYLLNIILTTNMLYISYVIFIINLTFLKRLKFDYHMIFFIVFVLSFFSFCGLF